MKYIKQSKRHIVLDDYEWRALVKGINEYRKQVIDEDGCVKIVNELLIKIVDAPTNLSSYDFVPYMGMNSETPKSKTSFVRCAYKGGFILSNVLFCGHSPTMFFN